MSGVHILRHILLQYVPRIEADGAVFQAHLSAARRQHVDSLSSSTLEREYSRASLLTLAADAMLVVNELVSMPPSRL